MYATIHVCLLPYVVQLFECKVAPACKQIGIKENEQVSKQRSCLKHIPLFALGKHFIQILSETILNNF